MAEFSKEVFVQVESRTWFSRKPDPDDQWDYGEQEIEAKVTGVYKTEPKDQSGYTRVNEETLGQGFYGLDKINPGSECHVVLATFKEGSTFGSSGDYCVVAVCSNAQKAEVAKKACYKPQAKGRKPKYRPWDDYFGFLESVVVYAMVLED